MSRWLDLSGRLLLMRYVSGWDLLATQHKDLCYVSGWINFLLGVIGVSTMPNW